MSAAGPVRPSRVVRDSSQAVSIRYNNMVYGSARNGQDVIVLSLGEAFFDIPLMGFGDLPMPAVYHYTHSRGIPELRQELARYFAAEYGVTFDPEREIIVTAGSKAAIYMALMSLIDPGDEVLIHEPAWVSYPEQVKLCYGVPVSIPHDVPVSAFEQYVGPRTKVIIVNNPNNPSGRVYTAGELAALVDLARRRSLCIISDEAYSDFFLPGEKFVSIATLDPDKQHTILVNSISKNFGISGWRLGYAITGAEMTDQILKVNQHLITCPASILQHYLARHFTRIIQITRPQILEVVRKRQAVVEFIRGLGMDTLPGTATFYLFLSIAPSRLDSETFCTRLLQDSGVSVVPGSGYGASCDRFVRLSVGTETTERVHEGIARIKRLVEQTSSPLR